MFGTDPGFWAPYFAEQSGAAARRGVTGYRTAMLAADRDGPGPGRLHQPQLLVPLLPGSDGDTGFPAPSRLASVRGLIRCAWRYARCAASWDDTGNKDIDTVRTNTVHIDTE